ncbi:MAG: hypothetical protein A2Z88_10615 [Omnitrophica WOR_2 bacterium GWA2_47_8]|nr:MAG: hypothetical protein A2Z88_10615 [Omnitrophica WOR_2 bacterium GWA2_47_8]
MRGISAAVLVLAVLSGGCATTLSKEQQATAKTLDYGGPLTIDYKQAIKDYFNAQLKDPYSARYEFENTPGRLVYKPGLWEGGGKYTRILYSGYYATVLVNAKNSFGAYIGAVRYGFLFKNNEIIRVFSQADSGAFYYPDADKNVLS